MRGCFRLHAARASTSRDKPPHAQDPGQHTTPSTLVRLTQPTTIGPSHFWLPGGHPPPTSVDAASRQESCVYISTCPTRCLDFGPLSPAPQARSPLTATTTSSTTTALNLNSISLNLAPRPQLGLSDLLLAIVLLAQRRLELYRLPECLDPRHPRASTQDHPRHDRRLRGSPSTTQRSNHLVTELSCR